VAPILLLRGYSVEIACRLADKIVVVTPNLIDFLVGLGIKREKIVAVSNGVNTEKFMPRDSVDCKRSAGLDPGLSYIGFVGSLVAWQGVEYLIEAFARLSGEGYSNHRLLIVGDGIEKASLIELAQQLGISENLIFAGVQPHHQIPIWIGSCDLLIAPKKPLQSGYSPLKIYEYMACGRPVLASNVEGLEFIQTDHIGLLFEPGNVDDLTCKLRMLLDLPVGERSEMGERARKLAVERHSWDRTIQHIRRFLLQNHKQSVDYEA
ncbi:MAG: glycosyltransferase family 4 protein, partial [Chloroflexota bacterium]